MTGGFIPFIALEHATFALDVSMYVQILAVMPLINFQ